MFRIEVLRTLKELETIRAEWDSLWSRVACRTPHQSWQWNYLWVKIHNQEKSLHTVVVRDRQNKLVGLGPFRKSLEIANVTVMSLISQEASTFTDLIVQDEKRPKIIQIIIDYLIRYGCSALDLKICEPSPNRQILTEHIETKRWFHVIEDVYTKRLRVDLGKGYSEYYAGLSRDMRYDIRSATKKLNQNYSVVFDADVEDSTFEDKLNACIQLNALRWGGNPSRNHPAYKAHYRSIYMNGGMRVYILTLNGRPAGAICGLLLDDTIYIELTGFDFSITKTEIGKVFYNNLFLWAIENGYRYVDFMTGEEPYKLSYCPEVLTKWRVLAQRNRIDAAVIDAHASLKTYLRETKLRIAHSRLYKSLGIGPMLGRLRKGDN